MSPNVPPFETHTPRLLGNLDASGSPSGRSTPALPPGLQVPLLGQQLDGNDSPGEPDMIHMPELGRVPTDPKGVPAVAPNANIVGNTFKGSPPPERTLNKSILQHRKEKRPSAQTAPAKPTDDDSFPALPKSQPAAPRRPVPEHTKSSRVVSDKGDKSQGKATKADTPSDSAVIPIETKVDDKEISVEPKMGLPEQPKRQHPGKLDISAANSTQAIEDQVQSAAKPPSKSDEAKSETKEALDAGLAESRSDTPANSASTSATRSAKPRTLRVLPTPTTKTQSPQTPLPSASTVLPSSTPEAKAVATKPLKQISRQPSQASIAPPETPASERMDDEMSMTTESHSVSRASSPPPPGGRVGSAPVRTKTKSQQKKERQERGKPEQGNVEQESLPAVEEIIHEPIIGRKKKTKKPAPASMPPVSAKPSKQKQDQEPNDSQGVEKPTKPLPEKPQTPQQEATPVATPKATEEPNDVFKRNSSMAQSVIESLQAAGDLSPAVLNFFKSTPSFLSARPADLPIDSQMQPPLTAEEVKKLDAGKPVRRNNGATDSDSTNSADRLLVTPHSRLCIHGLSREMEDRLLELETRIRASRPPQKYTHRSTNPSVTAAARLVDELLQDMAALMEPAAEPETNKSTPKNNESSHRIPSSKPPAYGDDALAYLNQFILPMPSSRSNAPAPAKQYPAPGAQYNDNVEVETPSISNAIPRTYTTGDPTYSVSGVDVGPSTPSAHVQQSATSPSARSYSDQQHPSPSQAMMQSLQGDLPPGMKTLTPFFEIGELPANMKFNDLMAGKAARDALAASLGAASNTLASVAAAANAAAANAPSGSKSAATSSGTGGSWQRAGKDAGAGWQEYVGELALPQNVVEMGADAIRQAIVASGITGGVELGARSGPILKSDSGDTDVMAWTQPSGGNNKTATMASVSARRKQEPQHEHQTFGFYAGDAAARALADIEAALTAGRKEVESLEKRMAGVVKKNRKVAGV